MSGGIVIVLAAALWLLYLVPTWLRRREYLATERNAVRLQQTLRILAETAELPQEVRVEATAREVALKQKMLRRVEQRQRHEAETEAHLAALAATAAARKARMDARALEDSITAPGAARGAHDLAVGAALAAARVTRRARAASSVVLLCALIAIGIGVAQLVAGGSAVLLTLGAVVAAGAVVVLGRLARRRIPRVPAVSSAPLTAPELYDDAEHEVPVRRVAPQPWTPQPLPRPLHLSRGTVAASAMASVDAAKKLRRAAALDDLDRRAAEIVPPVRTLRPAASAAPAAPPTVTAPVAPEAPSRFAGMGVVDEQAASGIDLDAALRRRRAV